MDNTLKQAENKMKKSVDLSVKDYSTLRAGRATPSLLEKVLVDYYGTQHLLTRWLQLRCQSLDCW